MNISNKDSLKIRVAQVKPLLRSIDGWKKRLIEKYPEYDTILGAQKIKNVINLALADESLTERLEEIAGVQQKQTA